MQVENTHIQEENKLELEKEHNTNLLRWRNWISKIEELVARMNLAISNFQTNK